MTISTPGSGSPSQTVASGQPAEEAAPQASFSLWRFLYRRVKWTAIFLVWYVLSIGPMFWHWHHARYAGEDSFIETFYFPLALACEIPWIGKIVNAYVDLWIL